MLDNVHFYIYSEAISITYPLNNGNYFRAPECVHMFWGEIEYHKQKVFIYRSATSCWKYFCEIY